MLNAQHGGGTLSNYNENRVQEVCTKCRVPTGEWCISKGYKHTLSLSGTVVAAIRLFRSCISGRSVFCFSSIAILRTCSSFVHTSLLPSLRACSSAH